MPALHRFLIPLALLLGLHGAAQAAICRVAADGSADADAAADGSSWTPATTLQAALGNANCDEIWVQQGLYKPTTDTNRTVSFAINRPLKLYGGFAGTETALAQRSGGSSSTTLSGDIGTAGDSSDNSYHVLVIGGTGATGNGSYTSADTVVDGFTVTAGQADGGSFPHYYGGGLYCNGSGAGKVCSPLLAGLVFQGNAAAYGGAIYNSGNSGGSSSPAITNTTFSGNSATYGYGGAIYNEGYAGNSSPAITNATFGGNSAAGYGGAIFNNGNFGGNSSPAITNTTFSGNSAAFGGAIYNYGGSGSSSPAITNATFSGNSAAGGGAIYNYGSSGSSSPAITNATFSGNSATGYGGAIYSYGFGSTSRPSVTRSVFWGNTAGSGPQAWTSSNAQITFNNSLIQGGCASSGDGGGGGACPGPDPLLTADPLLGPLQNNGGPTPTMLPAANSPVIDAGGACTGSDQRGVARPQGGACDLGAVERIAQADHALSVAASGPGRVSAAALPAPISGSIAQCRAASGSCSASYTAIETTPQVSVTLTATPDAGQVFAGWGGACIGSGTASTCTVAMDQARSVSAAFMFADQVLSATVTGPGTVEASPAPAGGGGLSACRAGSGTCSATYTGQSVATSVTLTATPDAGQVFTGWGGDCIGTGTCTVAMDQARSVSAAFALLSYTGTAPGGTGSTTAVLDSDGAGCVLDPAAASFTAPANPPAGVTFPQGVFAFRATGCTSSVAAPAVLTVTLTYPQALPPGAQYWKFGPSAANPVPHWFVLAGATLNGNTVSFQLTDNGDGDSDPALGSITDPGGPGVLAVAAGGVTAIPVDAPWMLGLLTLLLGGAAWRAKRVGYRQGQGHSFIDG
ncbi:choice-of-anchor U domain-containing protein [Xylophilus sp. GW821-FHT01B05]